MSTNEKGKSNFLKNLILTIKTILFWLIIQMEYGMAIFLNLKLIYQILIVHYFKQ